MKRFIWLYPATGLAVGLIAWNNNPAYMPVSLLILPAWYYDQSRLIAFLTVFFYFAATSHGLPVGTMTYLQTNFSNASFIWVTGVFLVSLSFLLFFNNKKLRITGLYIALFAVAIPPFGLTCGTHPLASPGMWGPGGGWLPLAAVVLLIPAPCLPVQTRRREIIKTASSWPSRAKTAGRYTGNACRYPCQCGGLGIDTVTGRTGLTIPLSPCRATGWRFLFAMSNFLLWPVLQSLWHKPDLLCATSNFWWAAGTHIPDIQHNIMAAWSQLFAVPLLTATNL